MIRLFAILFSLSFRSSKNIMLKIRTDNKEGFYKMGRPDGKWTRIHWHKNSFNPQDSKVIKEWKDGGN
jgi:hypothetical protein